MFYSNHLLLANPTAFPEKSLYDKSVIYLFYHGRDGAIGYVINQLMQKSAAASICAELPTDVDTNKLYIGGDTELNRGYVMHSNDYSKQGTQAINESLAVTHSLNILHDINRGTGPSEYQVMFGNLQWEAGKLDEEIRFGTTMTKKPLWLPVKFDSSYLFKKQAWQTAMSDYAQQKSADFFGKYV